MEPVETDQPLVTEQQPASRSRTGVIVGVVAAVLVLLAGVTIAGVYVLQGALKPDASAQSCSYEKSPEPAARDVGMPPAEAKGGSRAVTIDTSIGPLELELDKAAPCTGGSFAFLAEKKYFNGTSCHRLTDQGIFVLQCGDPSGTGAGGPGYQFGTENLPTGKSDPYPAGTLAMARAQDPNSNGSQFFIVYDKSELSPDYTVFGKVTGGLDAIKKVAAAGHDGSLDQIAGGGKPKTPVTFTSVKVQ